MKQKMIFLISSVFMVLSSKAQMKKDGTSDMRYNSNRQAYGNIYSMPKTAAPKTERTYSNGGQFKIQNGYRKSDGSYVSPHLKTTPDNRTDNNYRRRSR